MTVMETFDQIRDKVSKQLYGYENYYYAVNESVSPAEIDNINREAAKEFAAQSVREYIKKSIKRIQKRLL